VALLKSLVGVPRSAWPGVEVELRADAGFAVPAVCDYCEAEGIRYTIALITNSRLEELAISLLEEAEHRYEQEGGRKVRLLSQGHYQAGSWQIERRVSSTKPR
jgi:Transposase DDE domain group 1